MSKARKSSIEVQGTAITVLTQAIDDYISLTDIAKHKEPNRSDHVIQNWMRNRNTIEFLGVCERLNNVDFKPLEFEGFKNRAGLNSFVLTPRQWIDVTNAIGLVSKSGRYGGTYAHKDIAFEFATWISIEQLLVLANIEGMNAELIHMGLSQGERLKRLNEIAIRQMQVLTAASAIKQLKG